MNQQLIKNITLILFGATIALGVVTFILYIDLNPVYAECDNPVSNPTHCYLYNSIDPNFDFENERCNQGYYESWDTVWRFTCRTAEQATEKCMKEYPEEWMIRDGNLVKREIVIPDDNESMFLCAKQIMEGHPVDLNKFIEDYNK